MKAFISFLMKLNKWYLLLVPLGSFQISGFVLFCKLIFDVFIALMVQNTFSTLSSLSNTALLGYPIRFLPPPALVR